MAKLAFGYHERRFKTGLLLLVIVSAGLALTAFREAAGLSRDLYRLSGRNYPALAKAERLRTELKGLAGESKFVASISALDPAYALREVGKSFERLAGLAGEAAGLGADREAGEKLLALQARLLRCAKRCGDYRRAGGEARKNMLAEQQMDEQLALQSAGEAREALAQRLDEAMARAKGRAEKFSRLGLLLLAVVSGGLLIGFVDYLFISARRKRDHEKLLQASITDQESGLFNGAYFERRLLEYLNLARRKGAAVCVVLVPAGGSAELLALGRSLQEKLRDYDLCARYGPAAVALLLPEVNAEQLPRALARLGLSLEPAEGRRRCAAVCFPRDGEKLDDLLRIVQERLKNLETQNIQKNG